MTEQTETITILFAEISGSTQIIRELGDLAASGIIQRCLDRVATAVTRQRGRVVGHFGDELMCAFPEVGAALASSLDIQDEVRAGAHAGEYPITPRMHIGLHLGPVVQEQGQLFGDTINKAKRMVDLAKADQILTTQETLKAAGNVPGVSWRLVDEARVDGYETSIPIFEVMRDDGNVTLISGQPIEVLTAEHYVRCRLRYGDRRFQVDSSRPVFRIGRGDGADLRILKDCVSRDHGRLEYQKGRIIYIDQSTNGTFVSEEQAPNPVLVHHERRWLRNRGRLRFGNQDDVAKDLTLDYLCESGVTETQVTDFAY